MYSLIIVTMIGALFGFFVFNHKPAKVFMGDVGSLALGDACCDFNCPSSRMDIANHWICLRF